MTIKDLREHLDATRASVIDGEIEDLTVEQFDAIEVCVRIIGDEIAVANLTDLEINDHGDELTLILDGVLPDERTAA
jgi:hypothetical protein